MPRCPFCKGEVGEDLLLYGGHCPHCLNEIPGEESATDPGAAARARAEQEARAAAARIQRRNRILSVVAGLMLVAGIGAYVALHEEPVVMSLDDEGDIYIAPASSHHSETLEQQAAAEKARADAEAEAKRKDAARRNAAHAANSNGGDLASTGPSLSSPTATGSTSGIPDGSGGSGGGGLASLQTSGLDFKAKGPTARQMEGLVLSSDSDVKAMVKTVVEAGYKQLQQCYESRLKENPSLSGRWEITFVIAKEGKVDSAEAVAKTTKDREFEQCMVANVKNWKFTPISKPFEITKAFVFSR